MGEHYQPQPDHPTYPGGADSPDYPGSYGGSDGPRPPDSPTGTSSPSSSSSSSSSGGSSGGLSSGIIATICVVTCVPTLVAIIMSIAYLRKKKKEKQEIAARRERGSAWLINPLIIRRPATEIYGEYHQDIEELPPPSYTQSELLSEPLPVYQSQVRKEEERLISPAAHADNH